MKLAFPYSEKMKADVGFCLPNYSRQWPEHHVVSSSLVFRGLEGRPFGRTGGVCEQSGCYKATGSDAGRGTAAASDVSTTCNAVTSKLHGFVTTAVRCLPYTRFRFCSLTNFSCPIDYYCRCKLLHALLSPGMWRRVCLL